METQRIAMLESRIAADGADVQARSELGAAYLADGRFMEAAAVLRRAVELCPDLEQAWRNLALAYGNAGIAKEAEAATRTADRLAAIAEKGASA